LQIDAVPRKQVELTALSINDIKTRRVFILADGKKSLGQIYQLCNIDEDQGTALVKVLLEGGYISLTSEKISVPVKRTVSDQQLVYIADFVEKLTDELTNYLGPVAEMLVKRIELPEQVITKGEINMVLSLLAKEIEGEGDKQLFLTKMRAAF
jgi:hypothetical protein